MADTLGFNINSFADSWAKQDELRAKRQTEEDSALKNLQDSNAQIQQIQHTNTLQKREYVKAVEPLVKEYTNVFKAGEEQRRLSNSGNLVDALQAMQNAMLNPMMSTSDGRAKVRSELNSQVSILATMQAAQEAASQSQMEEIAGGLKVKNAAYDTAKQLELHGAEVIKAQQERSAAIVQGLQDTQTAQNIIISQMTPDQIKQLKITSAKEGKVNVMGFDMSDAAIDTELNRRSNLVYDTMNHDYAVKNQNIKLQREANRRILSSLNLDEKQALLAGASVTIKTEEGDQTLAPEMFEPGDINQQVEAGQKLQDRIAKQNADAIMFPDVSENQIRPDMDFTKSTLSKLPATSPAYQQASLYQKQLTAAQIQLTAGHDMLYGKDGKSIPDPSQQQLYRAAQASIGEALQKEKAKVDASIQKQAQLDGRGNKEMVDLYTSYYRGDVMDADAINKVATDTIVKGGIPPSGLLGAEVGKAAYNSYIGLLNKERGKGGDILGSIDSKTPTDRKAELAQQAVQIAVNQYSQGQTDAFIGGQAKLDVNPNSLLNTNPVAVLRDGQGNKLFKDQNALLGFFKNAEDEGTRQYLGEPSLKWLNPADITALQNGEDVAHDDQKMTAAQFRSESNVFQSQAILRNLDQRRPGLAKMYVDWWQNSGPQYAKEFVDSTIGQAKNGKFQDSVFATVASTQIENGINEYGRLISQAGDAFDADMTQRKQSWISYGGDPQNTQAMALQLDRNLSNEERSVIYKSAIMPILADAKSKKLDMAATNHMVDDALADAEHLIPGYKENPTLKKALNKMMMTRTEVVDSMRAMQDSPWLHGNEIPGVSPGVAGQMEKGVAGPYGYGGGINAIKNYFTEFRQKPAFDALMKRETARRPYDWYRDILTEQATPKQ